ncbi:DUF2066 domain-containing protein [Candidatus Viadribacter manganicus]|uniref:Flagellar assembly protein T N-terminal domain-containing protein n=1 Tax=Candidatus Viadribacter manganicus TaxID=1759059 RepID=A0A1B1ADX7_9PROT|nr:DUF2066 domain-containing protein [Candidatus Viadribacter manganicus]ANP44758.1 hypothetical protein ATE48_01875 [Candidatus Viadribacter manganicus]
MKFPPLAAFAAVFLAALCAFAPGAASAQGRDNVYAVAGVHVDETAANAAAAQQAGLAAAQRAGFERLVRRLTIPDELTARGVPQVETATLDRLVSSVDVEQERRSGTRYIGRLTVRFDPSGVRTLLRQFNLTVVDTRTAPVLVAPLVVTGTSEEMTALWREVWATGGFGDELVPLATAPEGLQGAPAWATAQPFAQSAAAASALYATLRVQGGAATASLVEIDANARRDRGEVSARINGEDPAALRAALASLADQASTRIQNDWKSRVATGGGQRGRINTTALYTTQAQWEQIKEALEGAAQTLISEIRIEAVGRQGALISFSFVGDRSQLTAELQRRGVALGDTAQGATLRVAPR